MKKLLLATLLTASCTAQAATHEQCKEISSLAGTIMQAKQRGVSLADLMSVKDEKGIIKPVALSAYKEPSYSGAKYKRKQVVEFKNKWYLICIGG